MNRYYFIIENKMLHIVSQADYDSGYNTSYDIDPTLKNDLEEFGCYELMEGIYEIDKEDSNWAGKLRENLINYGLKERRFH